MPLKNKIVAHTSFWLLYEVGAFFAWSLPYYSGNDPFKFASIVIAAKASCLLYFYFHYTYLIPKLFLKGKYVSYVVLLILSAIAQVVSKAFIWHDFQFVDGLFSTEEQISGICYQTIFYLLVGAAFRAQESWTESEREKQLLEKEIKETELLYLKAQMNPHFLFNTLNNIYGLSLKNNSNTSSAIRQLKTLMNYNEQFEKRTKILLREEVNYLTNYIDLYKLRSSCIVNFSTTLSNDNVRVEPMLLMPFIENAFKHGASNNESIIDIKLDASEKEIFFRISNAISKEKRKDTTGGIGIKNVKRRLELLYPKKHFLKTDLKENSFVVNLSMKA